MFWYFICFIAGIVAAALYPWLLDLAKVQITKVQFWWATRNK